jgi:hypothetical protein
VLLHKVSPNVEQSMQTIPLPPRHLNGVPIATVLMLPSKLHRITKFNTQEPFFGRSASNRFDDPHRIKSKRFGTCYLGTSLEVAIAETILHDELPARGQFEVAAQELQDRFCVRFVGAPLKLVDLTGAALKTLIGSSEISTTGAFDATQRWSNALHRHAVNADGLVYMSRHVNSERAVVVFDRAAAKLGLPAYSPLISTKGALQSLIRLHIALRFD